MHVLVFLLPEHAFPDSVNVLGALLGEPGAKGRDHLVQQDNGGKKLGLRAGEWKLVRQPKGGNRPRGTAEEFTESLFNLDLDPDEQMDIAQQHPDHLDRFRKLLDRALSNPKN